MPQRQQTAELPEPCNIQRENSERKTGANKLISNQLHTQTVSVTAHKNQNFSATATATSSKWCPENAAIVIETIKRSKGKESTNNSLKR